MTTSGSFDSVVEPFSLAFVDALMTVMTEAMGSRWAIADAPRVDPAPDESEAVRIVLNLEGSLSGEFLLEVPRPDAAMLASQILSVAAEEFGKEQSEALLKCINAAASKFRSMVGEQFGAFTIQASLADSPASELKNLFHADLADDASKCISLSMFLNGALMESLTLRSKVERGDDASRESLKIAAAKSVQETSNLTLVMNVELSVTLRFGQRQLTLREVLDLTSGSVIELDRQVEEPVELLLEGRVIARGEAVVIDGNYGLRVTEVSQAFSPGKEIPSEIRFANSEKLK